MRVFIIVHSPKTQRLDASCECYRPDAICQQVVSSLLNSSSCIKSACEHQTCCNLIFADLVQVDETTVTCNRQLTTCNRLFIIKPEQAMRTHSDIGLVIADLMQLACFWLCSLCLWCYIHNYYNFEKSSITLFTLYRFFDEGKTVSPKMTDITCMTQRLITR